MTNQDIGLNSSPRWRFATIILLIACFLFKLPFTDGIILAYFLFSLRQIPCQMINISLLDNLLVQISRCLFGCKDPFPTYHDNTLTTELDDMNYNESKIFRSLVIFEWLTKTDSKKKESIYHFIFENFFQRIKYINSKLWTQNLARIDPQPTFNTRPG